MYSKTTSLPSKHKNNISKQGMGKYHSLDMIYRFARGGTYYLLVWWREDPKFTGLVER